MLQPRGWNIVILGIVAAILAFAVIACLILGGFELLRFLV